MNKKLTIAVSIAAILAVATGILIYFNSGKREAEKVIEQQQPGTFPSSGSGAQSPGTPSEQKTFDPAIRVGNANDPGELKAAFEKYVSLKSSDFPSFYFEEGISQDIPLSGKDGNLPDLDIFLNSVGAKVNPDLRKLIGTNYYGFFFCPDRSEKKEFGIVFDFGDNDSAKASEYNRDAKDLLKQWEPSMLRDLKNILFPSYPFNNEQLNQKLDFRDGRFRYAEVIVPGGKSSINYKVKDAPTNRIYISTDQQCLQKALDYLFDI